MIYVLDTNVVLAACQAENGFDFFRKAELVAPELMWSESYSTVRSAAWRTELTREQELVLLEKINTCPVKKRTHRNLRKRANEIAYNLGYAKTYDAEFLALAELLNAKLVTLDLRLIKGATILDLAIIPDQIKS